MIFHNHRIIPGHRGGTYKPENVIRVNVAMHAFLHKCLYDTYHHEGDRIAFCALSGKIGKDEILQMASRLGGINAAKSWTVERRKAQSERIKSLHDNGLIPSPKGKKIHCTDNRYRWKGAIGSRWMHHPVYGSKQIPAETQAKYQTMGWEFGLHKGPAYGRKPTGTSRVALWRHAQKQQQGVV